MPCYLAEWYRPEITHAAVDDTLAKLQESTTSMSADGLAVELLMTLAVPADEVVFCVFAAESEQLVTQVCQRAGVPVERLTAAADTRFVSIDTGPAPG